MPYLEKSIKDLDTGVTRRVIHSVVKSILKNTTVENIEDIKIAYLGDSNVELENESYYDSPSKPNGIKYEAGSKLTVRVNEENDPNHIFSINDTRDNEVAFIEDKELGLKVYPEYRTVNVEIEFIYRASTENKVNEWADNILKRLSKGFVYIPHEIEYDLLLDEQALSIVYEIYNKREANAPYGDKFSVYFNDIVKLPYKLQSTLDGDQKALVFKQTAATQYGSFLETNRPKVVRNERDSTYETTLTYSFEYRKPMSFMIQYPLVVHNQIIDKKWINTKAIYDESKTAGYMSRVKENFNFLSRKVSNKGDYERFHVPHFDDWNEDNKEMGLNYLMRMMVKVDETDPTKLIDLTAMGEFSLTDDYKEQLIKYRERITKNKQWLFYITAYESNRKMIDDELYIDENLVLRSTKPLNVRKTYRFFLYVLNDFNTVDEHTTRLFMAEPLWWFKHVVAIDPSIVTRNIRPELYGGDRFIKKSSYEHIVNSINRYTIVDTRKLNLVCFLTNTILIKTI